ncbi:MAG: MFS transporter [Fibrobacter sp.]|nr:MFS transporter [Fibrobacter sp.]
MNNSIKSLQTVSSAVFTPKTSIKTEVYKLGGIDIGNKKIKTALTYSVLDGVFANGMLGLVETFSVAGAVFLNAPAIAIAILGSLPLLLSSLVQLFMPRMVNESKGRKFYVIRGTFFQSLFLIALALCGWLPEHIRSWVYVIIFALYGFSGNVVSGLWIAWMGDLVPQNIRGQHFAWRNRLFSTTQLGCALIAGLILQKYSTHNATWMIFALVFLTAAIFRLLSTRMLYSQSEISKPVTSHTFSLRRVLTLKPFIHYSIAAALMQGTVAFAGPFFNVFYIRDLKFDFFNLSVAAAATVFGTIVSLPLWGKLADAVGNRKILLVTGLLICTVPIPYVVSSLPWHIWVLNFYTGLCWSGYNLSNFNYLLLASGKERPEMNITFSVAMTGIMVFVFSMAGGLLAPHLPKLFEWPIQTLFLLSSLLRFGVYGFFYTRFY